MRRLFLMWGMFWFSLVQQLIRAKEKHPIIPRREGAIYPGV